MLHNIMQCDGCDLWIHQKCTDVTKNMDYYKKKEQKIIGIVDHVERTWHYPITNIVKIQAKTHYL